ncbi:MAG: PaaI family thioesterase [Pseudomonadales bacterium]|nr:PaaI family thioesterase [Pseudomonadales bacterium]
MSEAPAPVAHPFADLLGFTVVSRGEGRSRLALAIRPEHFNPHGLVHGAVLYALADTGMGGALSSVLAADELCTTIEIKIGYFRPWRSGELACDTRVVHQGRTTAALQSDLYDGTGRHLAQASGTFAILKRPPAAR